MRSFAKLMGLRWLFLRGVNSVITETSSQRSFRGYTWFPRMVIWRTVGRLNPRGSGCSSLLTVCSPYGSSSLEKATRVGSSAYIHPPLCWPTFLTTLYLRIVVIGATIFSLPMHWIMPNHGVIRGIRRSGDSI